MKTLVIDAQIWQTNAWYRGMGGYTRSLISALLKQNNDTKLVVLLNKNIPTDAERVESIKTELPGADIYQLNLPVDPLPTDEHHAKAEVNRFLHEELEEEDEVYYFVPGPFLFNYAAVFPDNVKKVVLFYDLIPIIFWENFAQYFPPHLYFPRFKLLFEADVVFTISKTTAEDILRYVGVPLDKMVNLDGSINTITGDEERSDDSQDTDVIGRLGLKNKKFFLMPTGGLSHKNNVRAAQAFRQLQDKLRADDLRLVVTSFFGALEQEELRLIAGDDVIFTGNVSDREIATLYSTCDVVLFPSLYEGLGIPVLEGVTYDKPVACSNISVFREIPHHQDSLYMFDPHDVTSISEAMFSALAKAEFENKRKNYPAILKKYSWERSANLFSATLVTEELFAKRPKPTTRIAVTCPDPRKNNDVAVFAQRLYGYCLTAGIELVYFIDPGDEAGDILHLQPDYVRYIATCYDINDFYKEVEDQQFEQVLHFVSGDVQFPALLRAALHTPGYIYIGNDGFLPVFQRMAEEGMISDSQLRSEQNIADAARAEKMFESLTLIFNAQGIIAEKHVYGAIQKAIQKYGIKTKTLEVPECSLVNNPTHRVELQGEEYRKVIDFVREL